MYKHRECGRAQGPRVDASLVGAALVKGGTGKVGAVDEVGGAGGAGAAGAAGRDGGAGTLGGATGAGEALGTGAVSGAGGPGTVGTISKAAASAAEALQLLLGSALPEVNLPARLHGAISEFSRSHFKRDENRDIPCIAGDCVVAVTDQLVRLNRVRFGSLTPDNVRRLITGYTFAQFNDSGIDSVDDRCLRAVQEVFGVRITLVSSGSGTTSERVLSGAVFGTARIYIGYDYHNRWYLSLIPYKEVHADGSKSGLGIDLDLLPDVNLGRGIQEYWFRGRLLDVALNNSHEARLQPTGWMDDRIADIFIDRIMSFALAVKLPNAPHVPFPCWLPVYQGNGCTEAVLGNLSLNDKTKVVLLLHDSNHWLVLLLFSTSESCLHDKNCQLLVLDSIKSNERLARIGQLVRMLLYDYWRTLHPEDAVPQHLALLQPKLLNVPQQPNACDCGYYSLRFVEIIVFAMDGLGGLDLRLSFGAGDIAKLRADLLALFNDITKGSIKSSDALALRWSAEKPVMNLTPMPNLGGTCYLNAAVAVFAASEPMFRFLADGPSKGTWSGVAEALRVIFQRALRGEVPTKEHVEALFKGLSNVQFGSFFQTSRKTHHDVVECVTALLSAVTLLCEDLQDQSFGIELVCVTQCANGWQGEPKSEAHFTIQIAPQAGYSLCVLLEELFRGPGSEVLDGMCGTCGQPSALGCRRQQHISRVHGQCFSIFVTRAQREEEIRDRFVPLKTFAAVEINETLTVDGSNFALALVVVHIGPTLEVGHYIYYRRVGGNWFLVNDAAVSPVSLANVIYDYFVLCNVTLCVYERNGVAKAADHDVPVRRRYIETVAYCLVAFSGTFTTAAEAKAFWGLHSVSDLDLFDFLNMAPHTDQQENRPFRLRCGQALLELAVGYDDDDMFDFVRSLSRGVLEILEHCVPELDVTLLRAVYESSLPWQQDVLPMTPPISPQSRAASSPWSASHAFAADNVKVDRINVQYESVGSNSAKRSRRTESESSCDGDSCSSSDGEIGSCENWSEGDNGERSRRVPVAMLERQVDASLTKSTSTTSRSMAACIRRIAGALDSVVQKQADYKGVDVQEIAVRIVEQSEVLRGLECGTDVLKLAKIGREVLNLGALACAPGTRGDLKTFLPHVSAQTLFIGLARSGFTRDELMQFGVQCSSETYSLARAVNAQLKNPELREAIRTRQELLRDVGEVAGRRRGLFSNSSTNPAPLMGKRPHAKAAAMLRVIVAFGVVAPAHFSARLTKSTCPLDIAVRVALGEDMVQQFRLQVEVEEVYHYYASATPVDLQYSEAHFYNLLSATVLIVKNDLKAGVCNKCSLLDETLEWVGTQARQLLPREGEDVAAFERLLKEVRLHVFRGQLQRLSERTSACPSHNPAFALGEELPDGVTCDGSCLACDMVVALAKKLISSTADPDLKAAVLEKFQLIAFLFGHNVLKSDAERYVRTCHEKVDVCEDGTCAVLYLDMMMKILALVPHESKEKWYGKMGWISQVAAVYWRPPSATKGMFFYIVLENWLVQKSNAGIILALFDATLKEVAKIAPQIRSFVLVTDDGPNYSSNECVLNFPHFAQQREVTVTEMVLMEGGSGKGPHDAIGGAIQASVRRQVSLGRPATTTPERLMCMTGPDGSMRVSNTVVALVIVDTKNYDDRKTEKNEAKGKKPDNKAQGKKKRKVGNAGKKESPVAISGINNCFHHVWDHVNGVFLSRRTVLSVAQPTQTELRGWTAITTSGTADAEQRIGITSSEDLIMPALRKQQSAKANASSAVPISFSGEHVFAFVSMLKCPICHVILDGDYQTLERHFVAHFGLGPTTCVVCSAVYKHKAQSFVMHVLVKHMKLAWQCAGCKEFCETASKAEKHCQYRRFAESGADFAPGVVCNTCLKPYQTKKGFEKHKPKCEKRSAAELIIDESVKSSIIDCLSAMPGMALFGATMGKGVPVNTAKLEELTKTWCALHEEITLFERGFAQQKVWKTLNPSHRKPWIEVVLLVVLWHLGDVKADFFRKGCATTAASMLDELGCKGHAAKKITPFFNSITKSQSEETRRAAFAKVQKEATVWVRDGLMKGDRNIACGVPRGLYNSDLFTEKQRLSFLPYFKSDLSVAAFIALLGMAYCTYEKKVVLDQNEETDGVISFTCGSALVALDRLYERGSSGVKLERVELFFGLYRSIVALEKLLVPTVADALCLQRWVSVVDDVDEWRGVRVPTELSFLDDKDRAALKQELESVVYPVYCTCKTVLGQVENRELELIACETVGGCTGRRWFHVECGHKPAADTGAFVCADCRTARPRET